MKTLILNIWNETPTVGKIALVVVEAIILGVGIEALVYMIQRGL